MAALPVEDAHPSVRHAGGLSVHDLPFPVLECDGSGGVVSANASALTLLDCAGCSLKAARLHDWFDTRHRSGIEVCIAELVERRKTSARRLWRLRRPGGSYQWIVAALVAKQGSATAESQRLVVAFDPLRWVLPSASPRQRNGVITELALTGRSLRHELRQPLAAIVSLCRSLTAEGRRSSTEAVPLPPAVTHSLTMLEPTAEFALQLLDRYLSTGGPERQNLSLACRPLSVATLIARSLALFEQQCRELGIHVSVAASEEGLHVWGDEVASAQILMNLIGNAVKYNVPGGSLEVSAERAGDAVCIRIFNSGQGMPDHEWPRMFQAGVRGAHADRHTEGEGLGLYLCDQLSRRMGGVLEIAGRGPGGTLAQLRLPRCEPSLHMNEAVGEEPLPANERLVEGRAVLLYVEDDPVNVAIMRAMLGDRSNLDVHHCAGGREALRWLRSNRPDVVVLDRHLADADGLELLSTMRQALGQGWNRPVILLTADASEGTRTQAARAGVAHVLEKPLHRETWLRTLASALSSS